MPISDAHKKTTDGGPQGRYDIFISHSSRIDADDYQLVNDLAGALGRRGLQVFLDRKNLVKGQRLQETLYEAINQSAVGLIILTRQAQASHWVEFEVHEMELRRLCGAMCILALRLDADCQVPLGIKSAMIIDPPDRFDLTAIADCVARAARDCLAGG